MQMYDGLPIITNKITVEEQNGIPHHLLGFISLDENPWWVGLFKKKASQIIREIRSRGRLPIVVGGTHYYTQALLFGDSLVSEDNSDNDKMEMSSQDLSRKFPILDGPTEVILERLKEVDPVMAERWHPNDVRKIRRSLEIYLTTGKKASDIYKQQKEKALLQDPAQISWGGSTLLFWIHSDPDRLKTRLNERVDKMVAGGLLDEVKSMDKFLERQSSSGLEVDKTRGIWASIGYKEFENYLSSLKNDPENLQELKRLYDDSLERTKIATRQYAKRQIRWIRLKLIPTLAKQNILERLYLLNGTNMSEWHNTVSKPALEIATNFLVGDELPAPSSLSPAAQEFLDPEQFVEKPSVKPDFHRECETCNVTVVIEEQWGRHLRSRAHRTKVKKIERVAKCSRYQAAG